MIETDITYSVVIPVYRSEAGLKKLAHELRHTLEDMGKPYEVIFVDDCSPDQSWQQIIQIIERLPKFRGIQLSRNMGQARATICGIKESRGDVVITMDDDLQHDPKALPILLNELESDGGYDGVFAYFPEKEHSRLRNMASRAIAYMNARAFDLGNLRISAFRVMRRHVAQFIRENSSSVATPGAMMLSASQRIKSVPLEHKKRPFGRSNYTPIRQFRLALTNLMAVSMVPLRLISGLGFVASALSVLLMLYYLGKYLTTGVGVAGWTTVVVLITLFSGIVLLSLGVIGEYLVRVLRELQYPQATPIRQKLGFEEGQTNHVG